MALILLHLIRKTRGKIILLALCCSVSMAGCGSEFELLFDEKDTLAFPDQMRIFWSDTSGSITRTDPGRTVETTVLVTTGTPLDIALHVPGLKIYWAEDTGSEFQIKSAGIDGAGEDLLISYSSTLNHGPAEIAIDAWAHMIYWSVYQIASSHNDIWRSPLSLFTPEKWTNVIPYPYTFSIALDPANEAIYFCANKYWDIATPAGSDRVGEMYLGHTSIINSYSSQFPATGPTADSVPLRDIAVDTSTDHVFYVIDSNTAAGSLIMRADLDFSGQTAWVTADGFTIHKLALDLIERKIYWTTPADNSIYRADADLPETDVELFFQGGSSPTGIAIAH